MHQKNGQPVVAQMFGDAVGQGLVMYTTAIRR